MGGTYQQFFAAVRQRESSGNYQAVNRIGFLGAYQFGEAALIDLGYVNNDGRPFNNDYSGGWTGKNGINSRQEFLNTPAAQDTAAAEWWPLLWRTIRNLDLEFYDGQVLNGVKLTISGMVGGSHLVGPGALRDFIQSGGTTVPRDGNNTPITEYINLFADFQMPATFVTNHELANTVNGGSRTDELRGFGGNDTLNGNGGNDRLKGGAGNDVIAGGAGVDTAFYDGRQIDYSIVRNGNGSFTISHVRGARTEGTDTLTGVERVQFADQASNLAVNSIGTQIDFALVVDTTGSMGSYIDAVKAQMAALVDAALQNGEMDAQISIVGFKDPGQTETFLTFTNQDDLAARKSAAIAAIGAIDVFGGGDTPEGANSGLLHSLTGGAGAFRDTAVARRIAMFTDAPVKDTELAGEVSRLAADLGAQVASLATAQASFGSVTTVTFNAADDGHVPVPVQIFTILVGYDTSAEASVRAIAEQNGGIFFDADSLADLTAALFSIVRAPVNNAPEITSNGGLEDVSLTLPYGTMEVADVDALDADAGAVLRYAIAGGVDANLFAIDRASGMLSFRPGDGGFIPPDADQDRVYEVLIEASDGLISDYQSFAVTLTNVPDRPVPKDDALSVAEDAVSGELAALLIANDYHPAAAATLSIASVNTAGTLGTLLFDRATQSLRYVADADLFDGLAAGETITDRFGYTVTDLFGGVSEAFVEVTITGADDGIRFHGFNAKDVVFGTSGEDHLRGGNGRDTLDGGGGHDVLIGGNGVDSLLGGAGQDILLGGRGSDQLTGGPGTDFFYFAGGEGRDIVLDFNPLEDTLVMFGGLVLQGIERSDIDRNGSDDVLVRFDQGTSVILLGVGAADGLRIVSHEDLVVPLPQLWREWTGPTDLSWAL